MYFTCPSSTYVYTPCIIKCRKSTNFLRLEQKPTKASTYAKHELKINSQPTLELIFTTKNVEIAHLTYNINIIGKCITVDYGGIMQRNETLT